MVPSKGAKGIRWAQGLGVERNLLVVVSMMPETVVRFVPRILIQ